MLAPGIILWRCLSHVFFCSSGRRIFLFLLMRVVATFLWVTRCRKTRHGNWSRFSFLPYRGRLVLNQPKTSWLLIISTSSSSSSPVTKWSHSTNENQRQRKQMAHRKSWTIRTSANVWGGNQMGNRRENTVRNVSKIKFLTKLSLMSRVLRLGRAWSSDSVIVEAQWSSRLCSGWDSTETPICAMIRLAITSRPLKLLGRFILFFFFSLRLGKNNLQCFMGLSFVSFIWEGNNHFWNFAILREHFRDGCIEIYRQNFQRCGCFKSLDV